jgi:hypothetical protein
MRLKLHYWNNISVLKKYTKVMGGMLLATSLSSYANDPVKINGFVENATSVREDRGLSKFRNTLQLEFSKNLNNFAGFYDISLNATIRGSYDGVYDLNDKEFGAKSGRTINIEDQNVGSVPHGQGLGSTNPNSPYFGVPLPPGNVLGVNTVANPNSGMVVLGEFLHETAGGVAFGVPVRPCDVDSRGCLKGYMDKSENELKFSEFNDNLDFIREFYFDGSMDLNSGTLFNLKVGKQQIVWGRTDLFRVLDIINPVDFSRNNIYDELEDIRIPTWSIAAEWQYGANETFDDINLQLVWVFDEPRPNNLGQGGEPNAILDAGSFFRGMNNCWENGCTVANFAGGTTATDFGPNQIGIRQANVPSWSLDNTSYGFKVEGVYQDIGFSVNAFSYLSQLPSLRGGIEATNSFTGEKDIWPYLIAFDIDFPRINMFGGSLDFYSEDIDAAFRVETSYSTGEEFANTLKPRLFSDSDVFRWVLGVDKNVFVRSINPNKAFLLSFQTFGQHLLDHEVENGPLGIVGMPDWKDNYISTFLLKGWWMNDRLSPQILTAYDWRAKSGVIAPSIDYINGHFRFTLTANVKFGDGAKEFSDCRTCNPFSPFTATPAHQDSNSDGLPDAYDVGLGGFEPLGRFRAGPIGMANKESELQVSFRYSF